MCCFDISGTYIKIKAFHVYVLMHWVSNISLIQGLTLCMARYGACTFIQLKFCIGNSTVSRGIWDKYHEWYFKVRQNIRSRPSGEWYLGSFEISGACIYPKYPEETVLFPVYTTRQRNFAPYITGVIFTCISNLA